MIDSLACNVGYSRTLVLRRSLLTILILLHRRSDDRKQRQRPVHSARLLCLVQIVNGQIVRSKHDSVRPSAEAWDQYFEDECRQQKSTPTTPTSRLFGLRQDAVLAPVVYADAGLLADDLEGPGRLLVDLDDQSVTCRRQSAAFTEQLFNSIDVTQQQRDSPRTGVPPIPGYSSVIAVQYYCFQGSLHEHTQLSF